MEDNARRTGICPPSLYVYFDAKRALYDAIFARGWGALGTVMEPSVDSVDRDVRAYLLRNAEAFVRWSVEHPAYSQLMFWGPVPGYEPSPEACEPAVRLMERGRTALVAVSDRGALRADAGGDELVRVWTIVISGVLAAADQRAYRTLRGRPLHHAPAAGGGDVPQVLHALMHIGGPSHGHPRWHRA